MGSSSTKMITHSMSSSKDQERNICLSNKDDDDLSVFADKNNPWDKLDDIMVETVLAGLPAMDIFRCQFVCKRWRLVTHNGHLPTTSNQLLDRRLWFLIFNASMMPSSSSGYVVYDMEVSRWRCLQLPLIIDMKGVNPPVSRPVAASGGLVCFRSEIDSSLLIVCNPLIGSFRLLPRLGVDNRFIEAVAMHTSSGSSNYKVFVVIGKCPNLDLYVFSSEEKVWKERTCRVQKLIQTTEQDWKLPEESKAVVVLGTEGQVLMNWICTHDGMITTIDTRNRTILMYPTHTFLKTCSSDLVECCGTIFTVMLRKEIESWEILLHVLEMDWENGDWKYISVMPTNMSRIYNEIKAPLKINCAGYGDYLMVCVYSLSNMQFQHVVNYNIKQNTWVELPSYFNGDDCLMPPFSFKPDIKIKV